MKEDADIPDRLVRDKLAEQEHHYPAGFLQPDTLWSSFHNEYTHQRQKRKQWQYGWRIAAAILLLATAGSVLFMLHSTSVSADHPPGLSEHEQQALDFIERYCAARHITCHTPVVHALRSDLEQSFLELEEIDEQLHRYGDDAALVRARSRIESHQARLIKAIVKTL